MLYRILVIAIGLACGLAASQVPEFVQQYTQRLGGHLDALVQQLTELDERAADAGLDRNAYVAALRRSDDPNAVREGNYLATLPARLDRVETAYLGIRTAPSWSRGITFFRYYEPNVADAAWQDFRPAIPASMEGVGYGGAGFVLGWAILTLATAPFRLRRREGRHAEG